MTAPPFPSWACRGGRLQYEDRGPPGSDWQHTGSIWPYELVGNLASWRTTTQVSTRWPFGPSRHPPKHPTPPGGQFGGLAGFNAAAGQPQVAFCGFHSKSYELGARMKTQATHRPNTPIAALSPGAAPGKSAAIHFLGHPAGADFIQHNKTRPTKNRSRD